MGRKPTDDELADPDFQALFVALEKVSKPVVVTRAGFIHRASTAGSARRTPQLEPSEIEHPVSEGRPDE